MGTNVKHTPGPWSTGALMSRVEVLPEGWNAPMCIADCGTKNAPESEQERVANARLIAAAPDLLAACRMIVNADPMQSTRPAWLMPVIDAARAAIARATT